MYGIKETKEIVKFGIELGESFDKALSDGKFSMEDLAHFLAPFMSAADAFEGIDKVPAELKDLTAEEIEELKTYVETELNISNDKLEAVIEKALTIALQIYQMVLLFKGGVFSKPEVEATV